VRGSVGRQIDREPGFDGDGNKPPVLDSEGVAEDGLVGERDNLFSGVGGDPLYE
jgi:hypothetical protein